MSSDAMFSDSDKRVIRRLIAWVVVVTLAGLLAVSPVAASTNHGLYWGIWVGQRFDYTVSVLKIRNSSTEATEQRFYVVVKSLPEIQKNITDWEDLPYWPEHWVYFGNGTEMGTEFGSWRYLWYAVPVGNWNLMNDLWLSRHLFGQQHVIDTPSLAGFNVTLEHAEYTRTYSEVYQKSTGVLCQYLSAQTFIDDANNTSSRTEISLIEGDTPSIVPVLVAAVLVAVFVIALAKKRR